MTKSFNQELLACFVGMLIGGAATWFLLPAQDHMHSEQHPIADPYDSEYHVHADFHIVVNGELVDLSDDMFMTTAEQSFHPDAHLHDNDGDVKHIHAENVTFVDFLESLEIELTDDCITLDNTYCSDESNQLAMYVNDTLYTDPITEYVPVDDDRILVYYGTNDPDPEQLQSYLDAVPADACYYSGTCPERGVAPPESCGLTCEL